MMSAAAAVTIRARMGSPQHVNTLMEERESGFDAP
jgi:hypothetical protein